MVLASDSVFEINEEADIIAVRRFGRRLSKEIGFHAADPAKVTMAITELSRNLLCYAPGGFIKVSVIVEEENQSLGIQLTVKDHGPGIEDKRKALEDGYTTSDSLGVGLPAVKRLMDEFTMDSEAHDGTEIIAKKWK